MARAPSADGDVCVCVSECVCMGVWERQCLASLEQGDIWWPVGDLHSTPHPHSLQESWVEVSGLPTLLGIPDGVQDINTLGVELVAAPQLHAWDSVRRELVLESPSNL